MLNEAPDWLAAAEAAFADIARNALSISSFQKIKRDKAIPDGAAGAFIPLVGEHGSSVQLGLFSNDEGCSQLARRLLQLGPKDAAPAQEDVVDAMSEIANMVAGNLKRRPQLEAESMSIGLPLFLRMGEVGMGTRECVAVGHCRLGTIDVSVAILAPS